MTKINRQGDVYIQPIDKIPTGAQPASLDQGRVVLAYGEMTGHSHAFERGAVPQVFMLDGMRYFEIPGERTEASISAAREANARIAQLDRYRDEPAIDALIREVNALHGCVALRHEEHKPIIHAPGAYKAWQQVEYTPEAVRTVAD